MDTLPEKTDPESLERWRPVVGYEGRFMISDHGRVMSIRGQKATLFKTQINRGGYEVAGLWWNARYKFRTVTVHSMVAAAFIGPRPEGFHINHISGQKTNNRLENLEYVTQSENMKHSFRTGLSTSRGIKHSRHKLKEEDVHKIRYMIAEGWKNVAIAKEFSVTAGNISAIRHGASWTHLPSKLPSAKETTEP